MVLEYVLGAALAAKSWIQYIDILTNSSTIIEPIRIELPLLCSVPGFECRFLDLTSALAVIAVGVFLTKNLKVS